MALELHDSAVHDSAVHGAGDPHGFHVSPHSDRSRLSRTRRMVAPLALGAVTLGGCIAVVAANPGDNGTPLCWSRSVFGVDCPFCGGLRATNSLFRGDPGAALDHNVVLALALPVAALMWIWWLVREWRGDDPPPRAPTWVTVVAGVLLIAFGVIRNFGGPGWIRFIHSDSYVG